MVPESIRRTPTPPEPDRFRRIALIRLSAVGDVIMALPALESLRRAYPDAHITWIVERRARNVLDGHPSLDRILEFPRHQWKEGWKQRLGRVRSVPDIWRYAKSLRSERFDLTIDFQGNLKSGFCTYACGAPVRVGYAREECREPNYLFTNRRVSLMGQPVHRVIRDLLLVQEVGASLTVAPPQIAFTADDRAAGLATFPAGDQRPAVVLHPGTSDFMPHKRWPLPHYARLAEGLVRRCGARVLISWGPGEAAMVEALQREARCPIEAIPDTPSMKSLGFLLSRSSLVVGGDTGPVHLAALLGVPTLSLMGPSDPRHYYPIGHPDRVFYRRAPCSPCRNRSCQARICLQDLAPEAVLERAAQILDHVQPGPSREVPRPFTN